MILLGLAFSVEAESETECLYLGLVLSKLQQDTGGRIQLLKRHQ